METKHTPGPWFKRGRTGAVKTSDGKLVASVFGDREDCKEDDRQVANCRLIAAAPELLEAIQNLLADIGEAGVDGYCENSIHIDEVTAAHAAIVKATQPHQEA